MLNDIFSEFGGTPVPKGTNVSPVTKIPAKQFLAQYMSSPIYKQRLAMQGITTQPSVQDLLNTKVTSTPNQGSIFTGKKNGINQVNVDPKEINAVQQMYPEFGNVQSPVDSQVAHELSHASRKLNPTEEIKIGIANQNKAAKSLFDQWNYSTEQPFGQFLENSGEYGSKAGHDAHPYESKADLDAVRYLMWKKGIYDTSKRDMTLDDLKKASEDKDIKNNINFKRLQSGFNQYDIIDLNNTVASTKTKSTNQA